MLVVCIESERKAELQYRKTRRACSDIEKKKKKPPNDTQKSHTKHYCLSLPMRCLCTIVVALHSSQSLSADRPLTSPSRRPLYRLLQRQNLVVESWLSMPLVFLIRPPPVLRIQRIRGSHECLSNSFRRANEWSENDGRRPS